MPIYRLNPQLGPPVLRHAGSIKGATSRGLREFSAGLRSVEVVGLAELAALAAEGLPLPVAARQALSVYKAVLRERAKADARVEALREKDREKVRAEREEEATRREALKAQQKAERATERKRKAAAERRAKKQAEALQQKAQLATASAAVPTPAPAPVVVDIDHRLPWDE
jgi:hypothetical protein